MSLNTKHVSFCTELYPLPTSPVLTTEMNSGNSKLKFLLVKNQGPNENIHCNKMADIQPVYNVRFALYN